MLNGDTAIIEDIYADPRVLHEAYRDTFVKSTVMVPGRASQSVAAIGALADAVGKAMSTARAA